MTTPEPPTGTVYALPPEPPVGTTVEILAEGLMHGWRFQRSLESRGWLRVRLYGVEVTAWPWANVLDLAGPSGVRVVEGGEQHG